jgi:hypothetical protein
MSLFALISSLGVVLLFVGGMVGVEESIVFGSLSIGGMYGI